uniref:BLTX454 n=1 Tax=Nephila pilipes TaxID=299642 RepID=A0A076KTZ3_NEPPI|nr:BLTX454 [Nephila pilipes]
MDLKVLIMA